MARAVVHASTVALGEAGVLVRGPAGSGKTTLALALVAHHEARGIFARLVADDWTAIEAAGGRLLGSAPASIAGLVEIRGEGIVPVESLSAVRLTHLVDLVPEARAPRMPEELERQATLSDIVLSRIVLPARNSAVAALVVASVLDRNGLTGRGHGSQRSAAIRAGRFGEDDR